jgi:hypothetical protein
MDAQQTNVIIFQLFEAVREGTATEEQYSRLDRILAMDKTVCKHYLEYFNMCTLLKSGKILEQTFVATPKMNNSLCNMSFWQEIAKEEKTAPKVEIPTVLTKPEGDETIVKINKVHYKVSKFSIISLILSAVALVFIVVYPHFAFLKRGIEVATLADSLNAKWEVTGQMIQNGDRFVIKSDSLSLQAGIAKLVFDNGSIIVLEGPAKFQILAEEQIHLNYGRLYAAVSAHAVGFIVSTANSKIIDLGTEFGIQQNIDGDMEIHVLKGHVISVSKLMSGHINLDLPAGAARKLIAATGETAEIACKEDLFVRQIDSTSRWIWKGQPLNLADVVGGGNGFSGGDPRRGIGLTAGGIHATAVQGYKAAMGTAEFYPVQEYDFVDGVFVPNGIFGPVQISSAGHTFDGFPKTSGSYWSDISPSSSFAKRAIDTNALQYVSARLDAEGQPEETLGPRLLIHPNAGITFDLEKIRQAYPGFALKAFRSICGQPQLLDFRKRSDFWVLLDGKRVFHMRVDYQNTQSKSIQIPIGPTDRFLTLATTDGGDGIEYDWCVFAHPYLDLERY